MCDRGIWVPIPVRVREYYLSSIQPGFGAHLASFPVDTGHLFAGLKRPGRESDHSATVYCNGLQNREDIPPLPNVFNARYFRTEIYLLFRVEWNCIYKRDNSFLTFQRLNVTGCQSDLQGIALFRYRDGMCQWGGRKCLAVVMPM